MAPVRHRVPANKEQFSMSAYWLDLEETIGPRMKPIRIRVGVWGGTHAERYV